MTAVMSTVGGRVCLITNAPVSQNPRLVKEADALSEAGYDVFVSFVRHAEWTRPLDDAIVSRSGWKAECLDLTDQESHGRWHRYTTGLRMRLGTALARVSPRYPLPELAYARFFVEQRRIGGGRRADLYVAHNPQSLPIAAAAARDVGAVYAFDSEDLHLGEFSARDRKSDRYRLVELLEHRYLPGCAYVTAASTGIARALSRQYGIPEPATVLNVFPWADRADMDGAIRDRESGRTDRVSFYWYSQITGLDRGLQDAIAALGAVSDAAELHIRGAIAADVKAVLSGLAERHGVRARVHFHEPVPPEQLLSRAAEHEVGLALEQPATENKDLCVSNKLCLYMLAGMAIIATRTTGQAEVLRSIPDAGLLYTSGDVHALAAAMRTLVEKPDLRRRMQDTSLAAARDRWNWEREKQVVVSMADRALHAERVLRAG